MKKFLSRILLMLMTSGTLSMLVPGCKKDTADNTAAGQPPVVATGVISAVTKTSATCGGEVTNDGKAAVISRGVCWSTNAQPTIANNNTVNGAGTGSFTSSLTGLTEGATYYVRAYATNSFGTGYGNPVLFSALVIGQTFQGGNLVYLLQPGDPGYVAGAAHGLICTPSDIAVNNPWFNNDYRPTGATATALGTGAANTNTIVIELGAGNYCAKFCVDLELGGYKDWFMPSKDELNKLYLNKAALPNIEQAYYWSSSEAGSNTAWIQSFVNGAQSTYDKNGKNFHLRPFRSF